MQISVPAVFFIFLGFYNSSALAALDLPSQLTASDRAKVTEILGFSSSSKILGNPYPLGGYSGIEIGYAVEVIPTGDLNRVGNRPQAAQETSYSLLTFGKGIYNNIDLFVQFSPFTESTEVSNFGGQLRWGFYEAEYLPAHLSVVVHANSVNYQNKIRTQSQGADLVAGFTVEDVTLYTGLGTGRCIATFVGGADGVTDDQQTAQTDLTQPHYIAGISTRYQKIFLAVELDRYSQSVYAAKLGLRF
ncbi:MAG: hypothetical protein COT73_00125 [Bdellovibrio sp. CG10_big_fil_rev_8_21_14_0_10_47_8]|nr:MAG: hypothetical protein COT73_00125 [Bdellovibrio sp. CG10_big_fil_rev_8_21_14_0_10_47_8]